MRGVGWGVGSQLFVMLLYLGGSVEYRLVLSYCWKGNTPNLSPPAEPDSVYLKSLFFFVFPEKKRSSLAAAAACVGKRSVCFVVGGLRPTRASGSVSLSRFARD